MAETEMRPRRDVGTSRDRDVETETTTLVGRPSVCLCRSLPGEARDTASAAAVSRQFRSGGDATAYCSAASAACDGNRDSRMV